MQQDTATVQPDARKNGDPFELAYYHYSVYMNKRRRTAWFSAANIDGDRRQPIGKREGDRWYLDTRIDRSEQLGQEAYEHGIDRGHLTRRDDTAWGDDVESATAANNDTFHFTNCCASGLAVQPGQGPLAGIGAVPPRAAREEGPPPHDGDHRAAVLAQRSGLQK